MAINQDGNNHVRGKMKLFEIINSMYQQEKKFIGDGLTESIRVEANKETCSAESRIEKTVDECIMKDAIVWVKSSCGSIDCGRVNSVDRENRRAFVLNFDAWSIGLVGFDDIIRIGVTYYSNEYIEYNRNNPLMNDNAQAQQ